MKKEQLKYIRIIANNLPNQGQVSNINSVVSGEDAILAGTTEIAGKEVEPGKEYIIGNHLIMAVDHIGRLKRAFKRHGKNGLIKYCKKFMKGKDTSQLVKVINMAF